MFNLIRKPLVILTKHVNFLLSNLIKCLTLQMRSRRCWDNARPKQLQLFKFTKTMKGWVAPEFCLKKVDHQNTLLQQML
jgi:hypothetical protein